MATNNPEYTKQWKLDHPGYHREKMNEFNFRNREVVKARRVVIKLAIAEPCMITGNHYYLKTVFHHVYGEKNNEIGILIGALSRHPTMHNVNNLVMELGLTIPLGMSAHAKLHRGTASLPDNWHLSKPIYSVSKLLQQIVASGVDFGTLTK